MTGSSLPARASAVRSRPYFSSAGVRALGVLGRDALAAAHALERLEDGLLAGGVPLEESLGLAAGLGDAEEEVLGRDVLVAETPASASARSTTRLARGSSVSEPPWIRARFASSAASSPRNAGRSTPSRRSVSAGMPSSGSMSALSRCSASRIGLWSRWAVSWAAMMASWAFWVNRSSCIGSGLSCAGIGLVDEVEEPRRPWPRRRQVGRQDDLRLHVEVAVASALKRGMPWPVSRNVRPDWVPGGIVSRTRPLGVPTVTSAPRSASSSVSGSSRSRSAPRPVKVRSVHGGRRRTGRHRRGALAGQRMRCHGCPLPGM